MDNLTELFCLMDDFCQEFEPALEQQLLAHRQRQRRRPSGISGGNWQEIPLPLCSGGGLST